MYSFLNPIALRQQFPSLQKQMNQNRVIYFDGPGGTQVPQTVVDAMVEYLIRDNSNRGGYFLNSQQTDKVVGEARRAIADFINARRPEEIIFGQNMTTLTYSFSRALARTWQAGDEIILSKLDHNANIDPWLQAAQERNVTVRWLSVNPADCTLQLDELPNLLSKRTKLVAVTCASNATGSKPNVKKITELAHQAGALVYLDAVHYAPHALIDVQEWNCDFLVMSPYKFFGPHMGVLYGKHSLLDELEAYKVRPASNTTPEKWETGTLSFESMAGVRAAVDYLATIGESPSHPVNEAQAQQFSGRRLHLRQAMGAIQAYEQKLSDIFIKASQNIPGLTIYGITDPGRLAERTPTFALRLHGCDPDVIGRALARQGIFVWVGHFYAQTLMEHLNLLDAGGVVRIGLMHYNLSEEIERLMMALYLLSPQTA
jgi:cysteine desulfurase family protein (TIGR01976 family)